MRLCDRTQITDAWTAFWREPGTGVQCLRGAPDISQIAGTHWASFAASLPIKARVLDIACGAGAAARAMTAARRDIRVTGIDIAKVPRAADAQIEVVSNTAMEALPFADASFHAAVSQFGFEYGDLGRTATELARVLAPGARFSFLVHHAGSSIVATNRARLRALVAVQAGTMRTAFLAGDVDTLHAEMSSLQRRHPHDALVAELARVLPTRARAESRERNAMWSAVEIALAPERALLEELNICCVAPNDMDNWLAPLRRCCEVTAVSVLRKQRGEPIAWRLDGASRAIGCDLPPVWAGHSAPPIPTAQAVGP
jgi:SAM-dependent methyltransferase